jgi:hypothetical protein
VEKILQDTPEDMSETVQTSASNFPFEIKSKDPKMSSEDDADMFHTLVAKLLFLRKRARPDIQTAVSFCVLV